MLSIIVFFIILCSGSALAALKGRQFEIFLPVTAMAVSIFLYWMGMLHFLKVGAILVCCFSALIWVYVGLEICKRNMFKVFTKSFFTPAFIVFSVLFLFLIVSNEGKLAQSGDEFSCWMTRVKIMSDIDDFTTASSRASFQSYPPIMALWQYMFQKVNLWSGNYFSEWKMFLAYQFFALSVLFPFLKNMKKDVFNMAAGFILIFFAPAIVYPALYWSVDIDAFVGILAGAGFLMVLMRSEFEKTYSLAYLSMLCFCLVLAKDVGLYFAGFILIAFYVELFIEWRQAGALNKGGGLKKKYRFLLYGIPLGAMIISKASWRLKLIANNIVILFNEKIRVSEFLSMYIKHTDDTWRQQTVDNTRKAFYSGYGIEFSQLGLQLTYFEMAILILLGLCILYQWYKKSDNLGSVKKGKICTITIIIVHIFVYAVGMGMTYITNFDESTAVSLGSYNRYMGMPILCSLLALLIWGYNYICVSQANTKRVYLNICFLLVILMITPVGFMSDFLHKDYVRSSRTMRSQYAAVENLILNNTDEDAAIWMISQEDWGGNQNIYNYLAYPRYIGGYFSIGAPFYDGDVYTREMPASEWMNALSETYEYVALHHVNDYFVENYSDCFSDPSRVMDGTLWMVDTDNRMLVEVRN